MSEITTVPIEKFDPNPYQPRTRVEVTPETAEYYGKSILEHGLLQIPLARQAPFGKKGERYQMGDGWLRLEGHKWLVGKGHPEFKQIPVEIREITDEQMAQMVFEANGVRKDLDPIEKAHFFKKYLSDFKVTEQHLASKLSISQGEVANTLRLLELPQEIQSLVGNGSVPQTHARHLLRLNVQPEVQKKMTADVVKGGVSVNDLSRNIDVNFWEHSKSLNPKADDYNKPKFDVAVCQGCVSRVQATEPWGQQKKEDRCLLEGCWTKKQQEAEVELNKKALAAAKKKGGDKILTSKTIASNAYEFLERGYGTDHFDHSDCKDCDKTGLFKYNLESDDKPQRVCLDPACMRAKKSTFTRQKNKADKELDAELTKKLGSVFHQAHTRPTGAMIVLSRDALAHLQADDKRDVMRLFPSLPKLTNGMMDEEALRMTMAEKSLEDLTDLAVAMVFTQRRRQHNYSGNDFSTEIKGDLQYDYAQLEGRFKDFVKELTAWQESNCRGCNLATERLIGTGLECCHQTYNKQLNKDGDCKQGKLVQAQEAKAQAEKDIADRKAEISPAVGKLTHGPERTETKGADLIHALHTNDAEKVQELTRKADENERVLKHAVETGEPVNITVEKIIDTLPKKKSHSRKLQPTQTQGESNIETETKTVSETASAQEATQPPASVKTSEPSELKTEGKKTSKKSARGASHLLKDNAPAASAVAKIPANTK